MAEHKKWMHLAIKQAKIGWNTTQPNPSVGAVIVKNGKLVSAGHTLPAGLDHAEIQALKNALGNDPSGAAMYVTLEPCAHYGKTPPCVDAIITSDIGKVIIGVKDPNPLVSGRGIKKMRAAGMAVIENILSAEIAEMYKGYFSFITKKRPYLTIKLAQTKNGCVAGTNKESNQRRIKITSQQTQVWVHNLRANADAILVSAKTAEIDNPMLDARLSENEDKRNPKRIVLGLESELSPSLNVFRDDGVEIMVFSGKRQNLPDRVRQYLLPSDDFKTNFNFALGQLYQLGVHHLLIEPGAELVNKLLKYNLFDTFYLLTAPHGTEDGYKWTVDLRWKDKLELIKSRQIEKDLLEEFNIRIS